MRARVRLVPFVLGAAALAGCLTVPDPPGARCSSRHYDVRADVDDVALVASAATVAERYHEQLVADFGGEINDTLPLVVCASPSQFAHYRRAATGRAPAVGFYSCSPPFAVISDALADREQVIAHELAHHFVHYLVPGAPYWVDEGLACELSHTRDGRFWLAIDEAETRSEPAPRGSHLTAVVRRRAPIYRAERLPGGDVVWVPTGSGLPVELATAFRGCPLVPVYALPDARIAGIVRDLETWRGDEGEDAWTRTQVAAAVLRFGMETEGWRDLREAATFHPDARRFIRWLRASPTHVRFPPLPRPRS